ncbi:ras-related protein Rab-7b-like [Polypterus senegalus]|uniref:ras-related protein Rab-7b-like n=1 Tax=Polypterus senegalus TaxID=55291 RepID=UPI00196510A8|nr:ras-related protein Rab-7b-like [Polypterus senegalus]
MKTVDLKIVILGALGVGKTSLLYQYIHNKFYEDYRTTLGASVLTKTITVQNKTVKLQIWDTGGQERFRSIVSTYYKGSDGCILAFDVTDTDSFEALDYWKKDFQEKIIPKDASYPFVVLGNKIDIPDRQVSFRQASDWCEERSIPYLEVSARDNINVQLAFETLIQNALVKYMEPTESYLTESIKLKPEKDDKKHKKKKKKKCC